MLTRRSFVFSVAATAVDLAALATEKKEPRLRLGVVSDVHVGVIDTWFAALKYFAVHNVDAVVVAGDMTDYGRLSELRQFVGCWNKVFPGGKGPDGRTVEKLFVYGNHDLEGWKYGADKKKLEDPAFLAKCITSDRQAAVWEEIVGEPYHPIWMKRVRGYQFIGSHWSDSAKIGAYLKDHVGEIDRNKPFFYIQHRHPSGTCIGPWAWGHDKGESTEALKDYPNAVVFSGHSHYTLTDERSVWQGAFTSINAGSLQYASTDYSLRENATGGGSYGYKETARGRAMAGLDTKNGRHGMLVSVYDDRLEIERRNFADGTSSGGDWVVPVPPDGSYAFERRMASRSAPEFAADAQVTFERKDNLLFVNFPAAKSVNGCRVFEYEVTAMLVEVGVDLVQAQRRVLSRSFHLAESPDALTESCTFRLDELKAKGHYEFAVRPIECFGRKGRSVRAAVVI